MNKIEIIRVNTTTLETKRVAVLLVDGTWDKVNDQNVVDTVEGWADRNNADLATPEGRYDMLGAFSGTYLFAREVEED